MEEEESVAAKDAQWIDCLRDVTQVAEAHACPLADMQPLVPYRAYRIGLSLIKRHRGLHEHLGRAFLANDNSKLAPSSIELDIRTSVLLPTANRHLALIGHGCPGANFSSEDFDLTSSRQAT